MNKPSFFFTAIICWLFFASAQAQIKTHSGGHATREHVVQNYERRREQLRKLIVETKEKVADHEEGRSLLEGEDYALLTKRIGLYERKLEKMEGPMDEREVDRLVEREKMRAERRHQEL